MNISSTTKKKATFSITGLLSTFVNVEKQYFSLHGKITIKTRMALHNFVCNLKLSSHIRTGVISIFPSLLPYSNTAAKQMSNTT